jgi:hypothetical protein
MENFNFFFAGSQIFFDEGEKAERLNIEKTLKFDTRVH